MNLGTCDLAQSIQEDCWHFLVNFVIDQLGLSDWNGWKCHQQIVRIEHERIKGKSFMYRENKSGPNTEPCGTPYFKGSKSDLELFTQTSCCRFDRNEETSLRVSFNSSYSSNLCRRRSWLITSNALAKSTKRTAQKPLLFMCVWHLSANLVSALWHEWCSLKPDWLGCSN